MGHLSLKHFAPLRNNFMPSRRHRRQTASVYLAKFLLLIDDRFTGLASPFVPDKNQWPVNSVSTCWPWSPTTGHLSYTLRRFGGRHPLCGIGVTSRIERTSIPAAARARTADSRPDPGPLTRPSTLRTP